MQQNNFNTFQQNKPIQNTGFNFNVSNNNNNIPPDDEFKEVEENNENTKKEQKSNLSNLLDSKLVNLDSLKGTGKKTNDNMLNFGGNNSNMNNYNFY
jgi:hypothetical protein